MEVRELTASDAEAFHTLRLQGLRECPTAFASSYEEECDRPLSVVAERVTPTDGSLVLGAWNHGVLVGTVGLFRETKIKLAHKATIWGVYVAPEARRGGVGRALMTAALARAAAMPGLRQVNLGVNAANREALALYEVVGFVSFGRERACMMVDGEPHDEFIMVCFLPGNVFA